MVRAQLKNFTAVAAVAAAVTLVGAWPPAVTRAMSPDSAPALPAPTGTVTNVSTVAALQSAVASVTSNQTIVIAPGTYQLTSTLWVQGSKANVTIRGATNNRNDVVLVGQGMGVASSNVPFGIWTGDGVTNLTIANLTIRNIYQHPIMLNAGTESPRIYNVRLADGGEQLVKANPDGSGGGVDNGIVEYSVFEYTTEAPTYYTNGVDVHTGRDWIIRHNLFRRIRAPQGQLAGPAILMWNSSSGTVVDGNTFVDNHRDISLGLIERSPNDHTGGIIRNNFIIRSTGSGGDVPIGVFDSPSTKIVHNTIWVNGQYDNAIEVRFPNTTAATVINNLSDRPAQNRDGGSSSMQGNVWTAVSSWFVSPLTADLHLTSSATAAVDRGVTTSDAPGDWDAQARPAGSAPDVGADESVGGISPPPTDTTPPSVSLTSPSSGASVSGTITFSATASDNVGVLGVRFTVNGVTIGSEDSSAPYQLPWNTATGSNGAIGVQAVARDAAGNTTTSPTVTLTVSNQAADTTAPTVGLTAPSSGATVSGTTAVSATASDNVGVASVQFTLNGVNLGSPDTTSPYAINWNTTGAANGNHALRAVARDAAGNTRTSSSRTVTVNNTSSDTTLPTVVLSSPTTGTTVSGTITLAANASDNVGVVGVRFMVNGVPIGAEDSTAPHQLTWNTTTASNGAHGVQAVARDAAGNIRYTPAATITVNNQAGDTTPPGVSLSSPEAGSTVSGTVGVSATASDNVGIASVQFTLDGVNLGTAETSAPFSIDWNTTLVTAGMHTLGAIARDSAGNTTSAATRTVTVNTSSTAAPWRRDLNGDGVPDLLFQHTSGQLHSWFMDGAGRIGERALSPATMSTSWQAVGVDDFNLNGRGDLLWQHRTTGQLALWVLTGTQLTIETGVASGAHSAWRVAATGDVNGDGHADIVWQHPATGLTKVWLMWYWAVVMETGLTPYQADVNWRIAGAADFNGDNRDDLVWHHRQTGQITIWYMGADGRTATSTGTVSSTSVTPGWLIRAVGDFNRNGTPDLVWHHALTGQLSIWFLNGTTVVGQQPLVPAQIDPAWSIASGW